jgi:peptidoglycan/LPS O-acetylase OafA/YrhL
MAYVSEQLPAVFNIKQNKNKNFLGYVHLYRAISAVFVVICHCPLLLIGNLDRTFEGAIFQRSTHMFIFIAGFIFQHLAHRFDWKKYFINRFRYVLVPYLAISIPFIAFRVFVKKDIVADVDNSILEKVIYILATGSHQIPYWFIPMIMLFYLAAPLFVYLDKDKRIYYLLPVFMALSMFLTRGQISNNQIGLLFVHFFSVYLFGMFCSRNKEMLFIVVGKCIVPLVIALIGLIFYEYLHADVFNEQLQFIQKMILSVSMLYLLHRYDKYIPSHVGILADISFGIYLLHCFAMNIVAWVLKHTIDRVLHYSFSNLLVILLMTLTICVIIIFIIKSLTRSYSKYLIGC